MTNEVKKTCDTRVETLIPWFISGQLECEELAMVEDHVANCRSCAEMVKIERKLASAIGENPMEVHMIPSDWASFHRKIRESDLDRSVRTQQEEINNNSSPSSNVIRFPLINQFKKKIAQPRTLGAIAIAQAAALVAMISIPNIGVTPVQNSDLGVGETSEVDQTYGVLSSGEQISSSEANILMQFKPEMTLQEFNDIFQNQSITLISGPTSSNAYLVNIAEDDKNAQLLALRSNANVTLAEPISAE